MAHLSAMEKNQVFSELLEEEPRQHRGSFSLHSSSAPPPSRRPHSGSYITAQTRQGSFDSLKPLESRPATSLACNNLLPNPPSPKNGGRVVAGSKNPLEMLRRQASKEKLERVAAVRGSLKQRLHDYTASVFFKQLSGAEQAAWWCGSRAPINISAEHATMSKEYLSAADAEFARASR